MESNDEEISNKNESTQKAKMRMIVNNYKRTKVSTQSQSSVYFLKREQHLSSVCFAKGL
jgi:hypothetical protein